MLKTSLELFSLFLITAGTLIGVFAGNYYVRLHYLGISDTVGGVTLLVILGCFSPHHWLYFLMASLLLFQGPAITHVLARGAVKSKIEMEKEKWSSKESS